MRCQTEQDKISHEVFEPDDMVHFCNLARKLIKPGRHGLLFCFTLQLSSWNQTLKFLTQDKEVKNDGEGEEVKIKETKVFEVERTPHLYTRARGHCQQNVWIIRLDHKSVVEQTVHFLQKGPSITNVINNFNYDAPGEMALTHGGLKKLMYNTSRLLQEERVYDRKRG